MSRVITNHVPRLLVDASELTAREREDFDYLDWSEFGGPDNTYDGRLPAIAEGDVEFFRYRGRLYDIGEFMRTDVPGWDGIRTDTFFSGVLVRFCADDQDRVVVGMVYAG